MAISREEISQIAKSTADEVIERRGDICKCVDWFLVATTAAEALEHNAKVSDMAKGLHQNLKEIIPQKQLGDLEYKHVLLQGYLTENLAEMALSGALGSIRDKCNVDISEAKKLAGNGFEAIKGRDPLMAAHNFTKLKGELLELAGNICGRKDIPEVVIPVTPEVAIGELATDEQYIKSIVKRLEGKSSDEIASFYATQIMEGDVKLEQIINKYNLTRLKDSRLIHKEFVRMAKEGVPPIPKAEVRPEYIGEAGIPIKVVPIPSRANPGKWALYDKTEGTIFGIARDTYEESVLAANRENRRLAPLEVKPPVARKGMKLLSADQISDFRVGTDKVVREGDRTFVIDTEGVRAKAEVQSDVMTLEFAENIRKLKPEQKVKMTEQVQTTPYLSDEGRAERLTILQSIM